MSQDGKGQGGVPSQPPDWSWPERERGTIPVGALLDPRVEPVEGIDPFPTVYAPDRLLVSGRPDDIAARVEAVRDAAAHSGGAWCRSASMAPRSRSERGSRDQPSPRDPWSSGCG